MKYSTDDSYGSDFDESYIEIYNNDLTKLINKKNKFIWGYCFIKKWYNLSSFKRSYIWYK